MIALYFSHLKHIDNPEMKNRTNHMDVWPIILNQQPHLPTFVRTLLFFLHEKFNFNISLQHLIKTLSICAIQ